MSVFDKKIKKNWSLKVSSTEEAKARYDKVVEGLKKVDQDLSFKIESQLEDQVEMIISKAEKELAKLQKQPEKQEEKQEEKQIESV